MGIVSIALRPQRGLEMVDALTVILELSQVRGRTKVSPRSPVGNARILHFNELVEKFSGSR